MCLLQPMAACAETQASPVTYRMATYAFHVRASGYATASQTATVRWTYPVILAGGPDKPQKLNGWLREQSLRSLAQCATAPAEDLLRKTDRQVVDALERDAAFASCGAVRSALQPVEAFGRFIIFSLVGETEGLARPQHGFSSMMFDLRSNAPVAIDSLFKPGALAELNAALADVIECERPNCAERKFEWSQVTLRPPDQLFIEFPYNPAQWHACGDGVEALSGTVVSGQLLQPASLRPRRLLSEVRP